MSFLSDNFSRDMRTLSIVRKTKSKNSIGETVEAEESPREFKGVILVRKSGYDKMIDGQVPINISSHVLYTELSVDITRDDVIIDQAKRFIVKSISVQADF